MNYLIGVHVLMANGALEGQIMATTNDRDGNLFVYVKAAKSNSVYRAKLDEVEITETLFVENRKTK